MRKREERERLARRASGGDLAAARRLVELLGGGDAFDAKRWLDRERDSLEEAVAKDPGVLMDVDRWPAWVAGIRTRLEGMDESEVLSILAVATDDSRARGKTWAQDADLSLTELVREWCAATVADYVSRSLPRIVDDRGEEVPHDLVVLTADAPSGEDLARINGARWWVVEGHEDVILVSSSESGLHNDYFPDEVGIDQFAKGLAYRRVPDVLKRYDGEDFYHA